MIRLWWVFALVLLAAGCSGDTVETSSTLAATSSSSAPVSTTEAPTTTEATTTTTTVAPTTTEPEVVEPDPDGQPQLRLSQIAFGAEPYVTITNAGTGIGGTDGMWLCQFPNYWALPDVELAPGETLGIALGNAPVPDLIGITHRVTAGASLGPIRRGNGEIGFYSARAFDDPDQIVDYVQWGEPAHTRSAVAAAAGIWPEDGFVPIPGNTLAISAGGLSTSGPANWAAEVGT